MQASLIVHILVEKGHDVGKHFKALFGWAARLEFFSLEEGILSHMPIGELHVGFSFEVGEESLLTLLRFALGYHLESFVRVALIERQQYVLEVRE